MHKSHVTAIHPGEVLLEVYMKTSSPPITVAALSRAICVPPQQMSNFIDGRRSVTRGLAEQLGVVCRTTTEYWLRLQRTYDLEAKRSVLKSRRPINRHASRRAAA